MTDLIWKFLRGKKLPTVRKSPTPSEANARFPAHLTLHHHTIRRTHTKQRAEHSPSSAVCSHSSSSSCCCFENSAKRRRSEKRSVQHPPRSYNSSAAATAAAVTATAAESITSTWQADVHARKSCCVQRATAVDEQRQQKPLATTRNRCEPAPPCCQPNWCATYREYLAGYRCSVYPLSESRL